MVSYKGTTFLLLIISLFTSCVREDIQECMHSSGSVRVAIRDKNYKNIENIKIITPIREDLPVTAYIDSLFVWKLTDKGQTNGPGIIMPEEMTDNDLVHTMDMQAGKYKIMITGNENIDRTLYLENTSRDLHPDNNEYKDIYIGSENITIPVYENKTIWLYRTKGKLLVRFNNAPENITRMDISVHGVSETVDNDFVYKGNTHVSKSFDLIPETSGPYLYEMLLAPSHSPDNTSLSIKIYDKNNNMVMLSNVYIDIKRNEIAFIQLEYGRKKEEWELSVFIDGKWTKIHSLQAE